jgi:hypothetical protein
MSDIAIKVEGLSKQYRIGEQERYKALRDVITDAAASPFRRLRSAFDRRPPTEDGKRRIPGSRPSLSRKTICGMAALKKPTLLMVCQKR